MQLRFAFAGLALCLGSLVAAQDVTTERLLEQMASFDHLTRPAKPAYTAAQASSYDRASKSPTQDWFANGDAGKFIRTEEVGGRREYVMADLKGPGAVLRIWSANPAGIIRFYFDGEAKARIEHKMDDLLRGKVAQWPEPFAYSAAMGTNLYFPFPYEKSLKITVDNTDGEKAKSLYYQVGYRTYENGTSMQSFSPNAMGGLRSAIAKVSARLNSRSAIGRPNFGGKKTLQPGDKAELGRASGSGTLRQLSVEIPFPLVQTFREMDWTDSHQPHNVLRSVWIRIDVDGQTTVLAPVGDFFAAPLGTDFVTNAFTKSGNVMQCNLPMPVSQNLSVTLENRGKVEVPVTLQGSFVAGRIPGDSYRLFAVWHQDTSRTRPMRDLEFVRATGEGTFVGSNLHITNPVPDWWGEGDEKIYVDGETFPSTFGTGTEDYYGYAWCSPEVFQRPYHAQPRCDGPGNFGQSLVMRWQTFDPIPFKKSFRFDMEMWHWADVVGTWTRTSYFYAKRGTNVARATIPALTAMLPREMIPPKPIEGALEGEKLTISSRTGGTTSRQSGFWALSAGEQLWWVDPKVGDKLTLKFNAPSAGTYEVFGNFCHARDYGIHTIRINGKEIAKPLDFFGDGVTWKKISLGTFTLPAGESTFEVECVGNRAEAVPRRMFGLDYLLLEKR